MNADRSPFDDELLSAVLDGEASPEERALVEASPEARQRLDQLRSAREAVAAPVDPLDTAAVDALVARALAEAEVRASSTPSTPTRALAVGAPGPAVGATTARRRGRWLGPVAAVAAAVVLVVAVAGLVRAMGGGRSADSSASTDAASSAASGGSAADQSGSGAADDPGLADLGVLADAAAVLERIALLEATAPGFDHQFDSAEGTAAAPAPADDADGAADAEEVAPRLDPSRACPAPVLPDRPGLELVAVATADLPTGPVVVLTEQPAGPEAVVVVVDATTCALLARGPA